MDIKKTDNYNNNIEFINENKKDLQININRVKAKLNFFEEQLKKLDNEMLIFKIENDGSTLSTQIKFNEMKIQLNIIEQHIKEILQFFQYNIKW